MLVVVALGESALLDGGGNEDAEGERADIRRAAAAVAEVTSGRRVVVTHGSGPQTGLLSQQSQPMRDLRAYPLDILGAGDEGMLGYLLEQELGNATRDRQVVSLLTQVVVDAMDPAFRAPTEAVGPVLSEEQARKLAAERGWQVAANGVGWRRVVASPTPRSIVERRAIETLLDSGVVVVCAGGGGIPVVVDSNGARRGVEAVVDHDRTAALLARELSADALLMLTNVPAVEVDWGTPDARPIRQTTPDELRALRLDPATMGRKVAAASWFVATTGNFAGIGAVTDASAILRREAGTIICAA